MRTLLPLFALVALGGPAAAQVTTVAYESFDYAFPDVLGGQSGGLGWTAPWWAGANGDGVVISANPPAFPSNPFPWPEADAVGNYAQQNIEDNGGFRIIDAAPFPHIVDPTNGLIGADGATLWFSFSIWTFLNTSPHPMQEHYNGFSLNEQGVQEVLFLGSPWGSNAWGADPDAGGPDPGFSIPATSDTVSTRFVVRMDYLAGDERMRIWLDPCVPYPTWAADDDRMVPDHRFNEIRIQSGGCLAYWDNIVIAEGVPLGDTFCYSDPNSTGQVVCLDASGSLIAGDNDFTLTGYNVPVGEPGYFLASLTQASIVNPGGYDGVLCLGSHRARFTGLTTAAGADGTISAQIPLNAIPVNPLTSAIAGDSYNWQLHYRDTGSAGLANFSNALNTVFQ